MEILNLIIALLFVALLAYAWIATVTNTRLSRLYHKQAADLQEFTNRLGRAVRAPEGSMLGQVMDDATSALMQLANLKDQAQRVLDGESHFINAFGAMWGRVPGVAGSGTALETNTVEAAPADSLSAEKITAAAAAFNEADVPGAQAVPLTGKQLAQAAKDARNPVGKPTMLRKAEKPRKRVHISRSMVKQPNGKMRRETTAEAKKRLGIA